jgi:hypothetical protein
MATHQARDWSGSDSPPSLKTSTSVLVRGPVALCVPHSGTPWGSQSHGHRDRGSSVCGAPHRHGAALRAAHCGCVIKDHDTAGRAAPPGAAACRQLSGRQGPALPLPPVAQPTRLSLGPPAPLRGRRRKGVTAGQWPAMCGAWRRRPTRVRARARPVPPCLRHGTPCPLCSRPLRTRCEARRTGLSPHSPTGRHQAPVQAAYGPSGPAWGPSRHRCAASPRIARPVGRLGPRRACGAWGDLHNFFTSHLDGPARLCRSDMASGGFAIPLRQIYCPIYRALAKSSSRQTERPARVGPTERQELDNWRSTSVRTREGPPAGDNPGSFPPACESGRSGSGLGGELRDDRRSNGAREPAIPAARLRAEAQHGYRTNPVRRADTQTEQGRHGAGRSMTPLVGSRAGPVSS